MRASDTTAAAEAVQLAVLRAMTPSQRLALALDMSGAVSASEVVRWIVTTCEALAIPCMVVGSFASSSYGLPRTTMDLAGPPGWWPAWSRRSRPPRT